MSKNNTEPTSLSEAIARLENASHSKVNDFKDLLEKDYHEIRKALEDIRPHLESLKGSVGTEALKTKNQVEEKIKDNPWATLGAIGLVAFIIGFLFGQHKKD
jgi:ElaB/YqjD/DUF883 family membrane-anchored ribosome-binding protein